VHLENVALPQDGLESIQYSKPWSWSIGGWLISSGFGASMTHKRPVSENPKWGCGKISKTEKQTNKQMKQANLSVSLCLCFTRELVEKQSERRREHRMRKGEMEKQKWEWNQKVTEVRIECVERERERERERSSELLAAHDQAAFVALVFLALFSLPPHFWHFPNYPHKNYQTQM